MRTKCSTWWRRPARVLTFHHVGKGDTSPCGLSEGQFKDFLSVLGDEGYRTVRAQELAAALPRIEQQRPTVALTFDDGYACHLDTVAELLARRKMTATFFIVSGHLEAKRKVARFGLQDRVFLCENDVRSLDAARFEVGSHSHTHVLCGTIPISRLSEEIEASAAMVSAVLGHRIRSFAYPYGRRRAYSCHTRAALQNAGFSAAFTQEGLPFGWYTDPLQMPRINIGQRVSLGAFRRTLSRGFELGQVLKYTIRKCLRLA